MPKIGEQLEAYCSKCELDLTHRIISMIGGAVKTVQCATCGAQHLYRRPKNQHDAAQALVIERPEEPGHHAVDYFSVLARARHLLPQARALLDLKALQSPARMEAAARASGRSVQWEATMPPLEYEPDGPGHFYALNRVMGAIEGDIHAVARATTGWKAIQLRCEALEYVSQELGLDASVIVIGVTAPIIALVIEEVYAVVSCPPVEGAPEDPRELERSLLEQAEQRRDEALERLSPPVRERVLAFSEREDAMGALKYLRTELRYKLGDAAEIFNAVHPWWRAIAGGKQVPRYIQSSEPKPR